MSLLIEIAVDTLQDAVAAELGGAHRIELCSDLESDGLSPSAELVKAVRNAVSIPIHAMVRPRSGDFCYSHLEWKRMELEIEQFKSLGVNGIVLGILNTDRMIDQERNAELIRQSKPLEVTFHRAFDVAVDPFASLETIINAGAVRLLTSGQQGTAPEGAGLIGKLIESAQGRIQIMPGAGITLGNIRSLVNMLNVREVHMGKGVKKQNADGQWRVDPERMSELITILA